MFDFKNLTAKEENLRDAVLGNFLDQNLPSWVHPIHISLLRYFILTLSLTYYLLSNKLPFTILLLVVVFLLVSFDGSLARVRKKETKLGAFLDHVGDWILGVFLGILVLLNQLLTPIIITLIIIPQLIIIGISFLKQNRLFNFNPSIFSRIQFFLVISSFCCLLLSVAWDKVLWAQVGYILLYGEIILAWLLALSRLF